MKRNEKDVEDACPYPPGIEMPEKNILTKLMNNFQNEWRVVIPLFSVGLLLLIYSLLLPLPLISYIPKTPTTWEQTPVKHDIAYPKLLNWTPKYTRIITQNISQIIDGNEKLLLENCTYILNNCYLILRDNASLVIKNAELNTINTPMLITSGSMNFTAPLVFTNSSRLYASNSSIPISIAFLDASSAQIENSNLTYASLYGDDDSKIQIENSQLCYLALANNASFTSRKVNLFDLYTAWENPRKPVPYKNTHVELFDSNITLMWMLFSNSSVNISGDIPNGVNRWDSASLCNGGSWSNITLHDSNVNDFNIFTQGSNVKIDKNRDNIMLTMFDGTLELTNSSTPTLLCYHANASITDSVVNVFNPYYSHVMMSRCLVGEMGTIYGSLELNQVKILKTNQNRAQGSILGDFQLPKYNGTEWEGSKFQIRRVYDISVEAEGNMVSGAVLSLRNESNVEVWKGETDSSGKSNFNLTYYHLTDLGGYGWANNFTSSLTLSATVGGVSQSKSVTLNSGTPILFSFEKTPEPPLWSNRFFLFLSGILIIIIASGYVLFSARVRESEA